MTKNNLSKNKLNNRKIYQYLKKKIGYCVQMNVSTYELVCRALAVDDLVKPHQYSFKTWALHNAPHILQEIKNINSKPIKENKVNLSVTQDAFLNTYQWRRIRMVALKTYGAKCQCCGATPANGAVMNVDHIKPRKLFPELALDIQNLQVLCHECNHGKGNWDQTDWRKS